jgi:hypothetical protein
MILSFLRAVKEAKLDVNSRQLMVFNDENYEEVHQCFTSFQFVWTHRNEFDMYVYQRSSDLAKLLDDLIFFANVLAEFEKATRRRVTKIVVIFGNSHYEIK